MRKKIVAANWKMNMTQAESARFVESMLLDLGDITGVEVVIVPPFTAIAKVMEALGKAKYKGGRAKYVLGEERPFYR